MGYFPRDHFFKVGNIPRMDEAKKKWLTGLIADKGFTMKSLSFALGRNETFIRDLLKRGRSPSAENAALLAKALNIPISDLIGDSEPQRISLDELERPTSSDGFDADVASDGRGAGFVDGGLVFDKRLPNGLPELHIAPGAGLGQYRDERTVSLRNDGLSSGHMVAAEWAVPEPYIRGALEASPSQIIILPVIGDSMRPTLEPNDRILVDVSQNVWLADAIYVIDEGDNIPRVKRLHRVPGTRPYEFLLVSDNKSDPVERIGADRFRIVGRVVGRFTKL